MVTQVEIARTLGLDISTVNKILNRTPGCRFRQTTVQRVFQMAKRLGFKLHSLKHRHHRMHARTQTQVASELLIYGADGAIRERGQAVIRDLSEGGALVSDVRLPSSTLPLSPFTVGLRSADTDHGREFRGRVLRMISRPRMAMGIEFLAEAPK